MSSHALCRYRRYRVHWPPTSCPPSSPAPTTPRSGCWFAGSRCPASSGSPNSGASRRSRWSATSPQPGLGLTDETLAELGAVDHVVHCGAIYDVTADDEAQRAANVDGTRAVIELARGLGATLHHVSSIAVAGTFPGEYTEEDFDVAQDLPTPYHQTKFEAEMLVRAAPGLRYRVYRPAVVVGDSRTGEMDKIDGPYYFFGLLAKLAVLPRLTPIMLPDTGRTNVVPGGLRRRRRSSRSCTPPAATVRRSTSPRRSPSGCEHIYRGVAREAGPARPARHAAGVDSRRRSSRRPGARRSCATWRPPSSASPRRSSTSSTSRRRSRRTTPQRRCGARGSASPSSRPTRPKLWRYWAEHLDPDRARRDDPAGPLVGRHVIITGASSGIGRASAIAVAERGATVFALARNGRGARRPDRRDPRIRRQRIRIHLRRHRLGIGGPHRQGHPRPVRPRRLPGEQRRAARSAGRCRRRPTDSTTTNA